jgi:transposase
MNTIDTPQLVRRPVWIGIDFGKRSSNVCVVDCEGVVVLEYRCSTKLEEIIGSFPDPTLFDIELIGVEAGCETHVVRSLLRAKYHVSIYESRKCSKFLSIRRSKTDRNDARDLLILLELVETRLVRST